MDSGYIVCALYDLQGNPVLEAGQTPIVNDSPVPPVAPPTSEQSIVNSQTLQTADNFWYCVAGTREEAALIFVADGSGLYIDDEYTDGLGLTWSTTQGIELSLSSGDTFSLSTPVFSTPNTFS